MAGQNGRALSWAQAQSCENATKPRCQCRCGGALHGAKRGRVVALPLDDPHSPTTTCPVCQGDGAVLRAGVYDERGITRQCPKCKGAGRVFVGSVPAEELAHVADVVGEPAQRRLPL